MESNIVLTGSVSKNRLVNFIFRLKWTWWHHDVCFQRPSDCSLQIASVFLKRFLREIPIQVMCVLGFSCVKSEYNNSENKLRMTVGFKVSLTKAWLDCITVQKSTSMFHLDQKQHFTAAVNWIRYSTWVLYYIRAVKLHEKTLSHLTCKSLVMDTIHFKHSENTGEQEDHFQEIKSESSNMHLHNLRPETFCCTATCKTPRLNLLSYLCIKSTENVS